MSSLVSSILGNIFPSQYPLVSVKSTVDGRTYKVRDMSDKQGAADLLAKLRLRIASLCDTLEKKYPDKVQVKQIVSNFRADPNRFLEATPDAAHTSYSVNKGEAVHLCLRQRQGGDESLVQENVMTFVAIHELAHICTDFQSHPVSYCGMSITDSPRYDPKKDGGNLQIGTIQ